MKLINCTLVLYAFISLLVIASCKDDDPEKKQCEGGSLQMTVDGEPFTGIDFTSTLLIGEAGATSGKRMDIRAFDKNGAQIIITFTDLSNGTNGDCVSKTGYVSLADQTDQGQNTFFFTIIDENDRSESFIDGELTIIDCDSDAKTVSGTFSFSFNGTEVQNGTFSKVCYTVMR